MRRDVTSWQVVSGAQPHRPDLVAAVQKAVEVASLHKRVHPHILRYNITAYLWRIAPIASRKCMGFNGAGHITMEEW